MLCNAWPTTPRQFPVIFKKVRRARATKFPYALFFLVEADALLVIACFHGSRDPISVAKASLTLY